MRSICLGGTKHNVFPQNDIKDNHRFIMTSFRRHICPPQNASPAVIPKRSIGEDDLLRNIKCSKYVLYMHFTHESRYEMGHLQNNANQ